MVAKTIGVEQTCFQPKINCQIARCTHKGDGPVLQTNRIVFTSANAISTNESSLTNGSSSFFAARSAAFILPSAPDEAAAVATATGVCSCPRHFPRLEPLPSSRRRFSGGVPIAELRAGAGAMLGRPSYREGATKSVAGPSADGGRFFAEAPSLH